MNITRTRKKLLYTYLVCLVYSEDFVTKYLAVAVILGFRKHGEQIGDAAA
jgi:hypothetical protein